MKEGEGKQEISGDVIIFHAGSLSVPFRLIANEFEKEYPGTRVLLESAGSVASARKITDLKKPCDIMASADYRIIEELLIPDHTAWHIPFASNEMVIAFTEKSSGSSVINDQNWPGVIAGQDIRFGRSDPDSDPCGYRTLMTFQLAEEYYSLPGLTQQLMGKDRKYIRPKEVDLLALLEIREIDFIFIYKSVAIQHGLTFIELPGEINLRDPELDAHYRQAVVSIIGSKPGTTIDIHGEAMIYSVTMLDKAPNPEAASAFLALLLDNQAGLKIMSSSGQKPVVPAPNRFYDQIPSAFKKFANPMDNNSITPDENENKLQNSPDDYHDVFNHNGECAGNDE
ncbi:MAG: substrate-binding domain-containing protein [Bacteroidales bacterium]